MSYLEEICNHIISLIEEAPTYENIDPEALKMMGQLDPTIKKINGDYGTCVTIIVPYSKINMFKRQVHRIIYEDFFQNPRCTISTPSLITYVFRELETKSPNEIKELQDLREKSTATDNFFKGVENIVTNINLTALRVFANFSETIEKKLEKQYIKKFKALRCPPEMYCHFLYNELGAKDWMQCYHDLCQAYLGHKSIKITLRRDKLGIFFVGSADVPETPFQTICRSLESISAIETKRIDTNHIIRQLFQNYNTFMNITKRCEKCQILNDKGNLFEGCLKISDEFVRCRKLFVKIIKIYIEHPVNYNSKTVSVYDVPIEAVSVEEGNRYTSFVLDSTRFKKFEKRINLQLNERVQIKYRNEIGIATIIFLILSLVAGFSKRINILFDIVFLLATLIFAIWYIIVGGIEHLFEPIEIIMTKLEKLVFLLMKLTGKNRREDIIIEDLTIRRNLQIECLKDLKKSLKNVELETDFICVEIEGNDENGYKIVGIYP